MEEEYEQYADQMEKLGIDSFDLESITAFEETIFLALFKLQKQIDDLRNEYSLVNVEN